MFKFSTAKTPPPVRTQELCESQPRWPAASWAPVPNKPAVSVDVKQHSTDTATLRAQDGCVKVEVAVLGSRP